MFSAVFSFVSWLRSCLELIWPLLSHLKVHLGLWAVLQAWRVGVDQMEKLQLQGATQVAPAGFLG